MYSTDPDIEQIDTLRLQAHEVQRLLAILDDRNQPPKDIQRASERLMYGQGAAIVLSIEQYDGSEVTYLVRPRNLSDTGLGFLHGTFIYPGTPALATLKARGNLPIEVRGQIIRCQLIQGRVHEIGMRFDQPIDVEQFVGKA